MATLARCRLTACSWSLRRAAFVYVVVCVCMFVCMIVCLHSMRMSFLGVRMFVAVSVRMATRSVAMSNVVEEHETNNVRGETQRSDDEDELGLRYLLGFNESLNGLKEDGETKGDQEDTVYERTKRLRTLPLHIVSIGSAAISRLDSLRRCIF